MYRLVKWLYYEWYVPHDTDIDECNKVTSPCEDICTNTPGTYECSCSTLGDIVTEGGQCVGMYKFASL